LGVVVVATEIDAPETGVGIADHGALNGVDKGVALAERQVEACVHARTAQDVVEQVEGHAALVVDGVGAAAGDDMRLVGLHVADDGLWGGGW